jgi:hypothetical protein
MLMACNQANDQEATRRTGRNIGSHAAAALQGIQTS